MTWRVWLRRAAIAVNLFFVIAMAFAAVLLHRGEVDFSGFALLTAPSLLAILSLTVGQDR